MLASKFKSIYLKLELRIQSFLNLKLQTFENCRLNLELKCLSSKKKLLKIVKVLFAIKEV